jgi:hypothetical protein
VGRRVFQDLADLVDRRREAVVEVDEGVVRPETLLQFVPQDDFARPFY